MRDARGERLLFAPRDARVLGVTRGLRRWGEVGLLVLEDDGRTLSFVGPQRSRRVTIAPSLISDAILSPVASHVAYSTQRGEVFVYSMDHDTFLYRVLREDG
jgi:hypothetical protein